MAYSFFSPSSLTTFFAGFFTAVFGAGAASFLAAAGFLSPSAALGLAGGRLAPNFGDGFYGRLGTISPL
jgi:hypothetical protein